MTVKLVQLVRFHKKLYCLNYLGLKVQFLVCSAAVICGQPLINMYCKFCILLGPQEESVLVYQPCCIKTKRYRSYRRSLEGNGYTCMRGNSLFLLSISVLSTLKEIALEGANSFLLGWIPLIRGLL